MKDGAQSNPSLWAFRYIDVNNKGEVTLYVFPLSMNGILFRSQGSSDIQYHGNQSDYIENEYKRQTMTVKGNEITVNKVIDTINNGYPVTDIMNDNFHLDDENHLSVTTRSKRIIASETMGTDTYTSPYTRVEATDWVDCYKQSVPFIGNGDI